MRPLRVSFYGINDEHTATLQRITQQVQDLELTILADEEAVINATSAKSFDLLLLDYDLDELLQTRLHKMVELVYPEAAYTSVSFEFESFVIFKINQLLQNWKEANSDEKYSFLDNPL